MTRILTAVVAGGRTRDPVADPLSVPWWSLTKTALAAAALALVAGSALALDRPLAGRPFTLRELLQHTAGLPDYGGLRDYHEAVARGDAPWSEERLLTRVDAEKLLFPPGQGWTYSNVGYLLVRRIVEQATAEDIDAALRRLVFAPLGVSGVRVAREPADLAGTAWGNPTGYHPGWVYHGLLLGTPAEASLFFHRLLTGRLLPAGLLGVMCEPRPLGGPVPGRPWRSAGLRPRPHDRRGGIGGPMPRSHRPGAGQHLRGLSLSRSRPAGYGRGLRLGGRPGCSRGGGDRSPARAPLRRQRSRALTA